MDPAVTFPDALIQNENGSSRGITVINVADDTTAWDVVERVVQAFTRGAARVWVLLSHVELVYVYTSPTQVRVLTRTDELTGDPLIPGFRLPLAELFPTTAPTP